MNFNCGIVRTTIVLDLSISYIVNDKSFRKVSESFTPFYAERFFSCELGTVCRPTDIHETLNIIYNILVIEFFREVQRT